MKLKRYTGLIFGLILGFCIFGATSADAFSLFNSDVKKAKEFMAAGMYPQAISLLEKRINDKPTDAEAHYQLGICYINSGNYGSADERFASAVKLEPDYGYQIGGEFKRAGTTALNKGQVGQAQNLFARAVKYQPALKKEVAQECFNAGKFYINRGQSSVADGLFSMASRYDGSLNSEIKDIATAYGKGLLEQAKNKPKKQQKRYIDEARKYLSKKEIETVFPPPSWKTVFSKEFVGVGFTGGDEPKDNDGTIHTVECGRTLKVGDRVIVETQGNSNAEVWYSARWRKYSRPIINQTATSGYICVRAKKGVKFKVIVQRYQ